MFREKKKNIVNEKIVRILFSKIIFIFYKIGRPNILDTNIIIYLFILDNVDKLCSKYIQ